jgi:hypothetical protein
LIATIHSGVRHEERIVIHGRALEFRIEHW